MYGWTACGPSVQNISGPKIISGFIQLYHGAARKQKAASDGVAQGSVTDRESAEVRRAEGEARGAGFSGAWPGQIIGLAFRPKLIEAIGCTMAKSKTYTQDQLEAAKQKLDALPDLSKDKISTPEMLAALKDQILALSESKGYSVSEIKSALEMADVQASVKAISEVIATSKKPRTPRKAAAKSSS